MSDIMTNCECWRPLCQVRSGLPCIAASCVRRCRVDDICAVMLLWVGSHVWSARVWCLGHGVCVMRCVSIECKVNHQHDTQHNMTARSVLKLLSHAPLKSHFQIMACVMPCWVLVHAIVLLLLCRLLWRLSLQRGMQCRPCSTCVPNTVSDCNDC